MSCIINIGLMISYIKKSLKPHGLSDFFVAPFCVIRNCSDTRFILETVFGILSVYIQTFAEKSLKNSLDD